ncbi:clarin-2 [Latimeria chalumnae]|uniref:clarin-2 n=1 Tax=Latimeria chalumnae TaxID=7897 RepID=UPI0003C1581F|nr:PREDICTED: clarin-2 [Latimeria chalumnae]|eukprot:XP_005990485.1 PREDICTED: clarin-2 [Latimeria chalumnae]
MPSCLKKTFLSLASVLSFVSVILLFVALGTQNWVTGKILCKTGAELVNATDLELVKFIGDIYYGLFQGGKIRQCGLGGRRSKFTVFPHMVKTLNTALHVMIIIFLSIAIAFALVSFGFCIYNAIRIPYQSIKGPTGIYLWNLIAGAFGVFAVVSFMAAVKLHHLTDRIANFRENGFQFLTLEEGYEFSFWLCVASTVVHVVNLPLVAISGIHVPKFKAKTEEVTVTADGLMY